MSFRDGAAVEEPAFAGSTGAASDSRFLNGCAVSE